MTTADAATGPNPIGQQEKALPDRAFLEKAQYDKTLQEKALQEKALRSLGALPPFSPILNRLIASLANENVPFSKLADLIEKDTVLAGSVLHLVNSALYARRGNISSVRHAVALLGFNKLRNAVLGMSVAKMWSRVRTPTTWSMTRFNTHSAATAILSDFLSQRLPVEYAEGAFIAGLLHDVGRLLIAIGLGEEHERIRRLHEIEQDGMRPDLVDCERAVLGFSHVELSVQALESWNLPQPIQLAVRDHHSYGDYEGHDSPPPDQEGRANPRAPRGEVPLARVLAAADQYVHCNGVSILLDKAMADSSTARIRQPLLIERLGLDPERLNTTLTEFKTEYASMVQFFR